MKQTIVSWVLASLVVSLAGCMTEQQEEGNQMGTRIQHLNPAGLNRNPAFTNVISVEGEGKLLIIGEQNAVDSSGKIIGKGDIGKQAEQVLKNLIVACEAGGGKIENIVKWNVYIVSGQPPQAGFAAFQKVWGNRPNPPTITVLFVAGLAHPDFLIGMDAMAVIPN